MIPKSFQNGKFSAKPSAHNPIYKMKMFCQCPYNDTRKTFKSIWQLHMHLQIHHKTEVRRNQITEALAKRLIGELM